MTLEDAARQAIAGDKEALNQLVTTIQGDLYGLALRMLCNRDDAEDATQEILIRIVTRLSQFDFRSKLKTWAYRVAVNYILDVKKSAVERLHMSFEQMAEEITGGLSQNAPQDAEQSLLVEEVKIGCSLGMLQCLEHIHCYCKGARTSLNQAWASVAVIKAMASEMAWSNASVLRGRLERRYCLIFDHAFSMGLRSGE